MSDRNIARRARAVVVFAGTDISREIAPYLLSLSFVDNEADETDDLSIRLQDRDGVWLRKWLGSYTEAIGLRIEAGVVRENWNGDGKDEFLSFGEFELDSIDVSGPPSVVSLKATSLPFSARVRQTKKSRAWESVKLSGIAREIAAQNGMQWLFESSKDPYFERYEQTDISDIAMLSGLCQKAGISLKATNNILVLFDQAAYEARPPALTIQHGDMKNIKNGFIPKNLTQYSQYRLRASEADVAFTSCRVSYVNPDTGKKIEAVAKVPNFDESAKNNQQLEIAAKVASIAEAMNLAEKQLRLHNKFSKSASFSLPGNPNIAAGLTLSLLNFGLWSGKYIIGKAVHSIGNGYTTQIDLRRVLSY